MGDPRTAVDSRQFLLGFMERFPHFRDTELYLSGESYAGEQKVDNIPLILYTFEMRHTPMQSISGHYVPNLAREVIRVSPSLCLFNRTMAVIN